MQSLGKLLQVAGMKGHCQVQGKARGRGVRMGWFVQGQETQPTGQAALGTAGVDLGAKYSFLHRQITYIYKQVLIGKTASCSW